MSIISYLKNYSDLQNLSNWDLIVSFLHWNGTNAGKLPDQVEILVRRNGDGFGCDPEAFDALFDWSQVRDSSDEAIQRMAKIIRDYLLCEKLRVLSQIPHQQVSN